MVEYINTGKKVKPTCDDWEDLTCNKVYDVFTDGAIEFVFDDVGVRCYQSSAIFEAVDDVVEYTNTGKKVKRICDGLDLTHNKVYDVFTDGDFEFIIDDVGDKRFVDKDNFDFNKWYELVDDVVETNNKFKEGDKVMVVNTDYISAYDVGVRVGDIGTVIESWVDRYLVKFEGIGYDCDWWFTDNCIELVGGRNDVNTTKTLDKKYNPLEVQQSGNHYKNGEIQPIEYSERNNLSMCQGNIVKYISRHKEKNGVDDLAKVVHYALLEALFVYGEDGATELRGKIDSLINIKNNVN